uniref:Ovule protein n=1 Tax=Parascaris univalens TaxID=6257 RepID=A0A915AXF4_PARUN
SSSASSKNAISPITSPIIGNVSFVAESQHLELSEDRRQTWRGTSIFKRGDFLVPSKFFLLVPTRKKRQRQAHQ